MLRQLSALVACAVLAACSTGSSPASDEATEEATRTSTETSSPSPDQPAESPTANDQGEESGGEVEDEELAAGPTDEPTKAPSREFSTEMTASQGYPGINGDYLPAQVRVGHHDGYERIVVEYTGSGTLNWAADYSEQPIEEGSGFVIDMAGSKFLTVWVSGVSYPGEGEEIDLQPTGMNQLVTVRDVHVDSPFEGMHTVFIGLDDKLPYHVQVLHDPERLVIDVKTD